MQDVRKNKDIRDRLPVYDFLPHSEQRSRAYLGLWYRCGFQYGSVLSLKYLKVREWETRIKREREKEATFSYCGKTLIISCLSLPPWSQCGKGKKAKGYYITVKNICYSIIPFVFAKITAVTSLIYFLILIFWNANKKKFHVCNRRKRML